MKRSKTISDYILIKTETDSHWDCCRFAIIYTPASWRYKMQKRLWKLELFQDDDSFYQHAYFDASVEFYQDGIEVDKILSPDENWAFVKVKPGELEKFPLPENKLEAHQLILTKYGGAYFIAYGKHTSEEFRTLNFDPEKLVNPGTNR